MIINRRGFGPAINYNNMDMNGKPKPDLERVEQARQAFMRGEMSADDYWNIRAFEYGKWK